MFISNRIITPKFCSPVALRQLAEVAQSRDNSPMYSVYALYNKDAKKIYIGQTEDLQQRITLHNDKIFHNSYTSRYSGGWILIYEEEAEDRASALKRERQLKSYRGREFVRKYIPRN